MTAASPGPQLFSHLGKQRSSFSRDRRRAFLLSLFGQAVILALVIYFTRSAIGHPPKIVDGAPDPRDSKLVFSGSNGGGGGNHELLLESHGSPPRASLDPQIVSPTVHLPSRIPKLLIAATVMMAPDVKFPTDRIGDPSSPFTKWLSDGPGGPGGIGRGCCDGIGPKTGPYVGDGTPGLVPMGKGVTAPEAIYSPEPSFSDEARKAKHQGIVLLMVVVGKDGRPYDIHVRQSLGMGLDEQAIETLKNWRFRPATLNGQPVATQIAVEVNFRLY